MVEWRCVTYDIQSNLTFSRCSKFVSFLGRSREAETAERLQTKGFERALRHKT